MNKFKTVIGMIWALSVMGLIGCVEEFEANTKDMPAEGLVVEGDIVSDSAVVFHLSRTIPLTNSKENEALFNDYMDVVAEVSVMGSDGASWPGVWLGKGSYQVNVGTLQPDVEYHLDIKYNGDNYSSRPQKPLETSGIESVTFKQPDLEGPVSILLNTPENSRNETKYYLWYFEEDWEVRAKFASVNLYDLDLDKIVTYDYPPVAQGWCHYGTDQIMLGSTESNAANRVVGKVIRTIANTDHRLSVLYSIRIQQRDLSREEYEYYQVRAKQNNGMGGLFTPQPSELPTNIICSDPSRKVIGYVGCNMGVAKHQLYISSDDVNYLDEFDCKEGEGPEGSNLENYLAGFQVSNIMYTGLQYIIDWARMECVDVRKLLADPQGRPSWWPNPYLYYQEKE